MAEWFRSWHGAPSDLKLRAVARASKAGVSVAAHLWWLILDMASQSDERGIVRDCDPVILSEAVDTSVAKVAAIIDAMVDRGMLERLPNGTGRAVRVTKWQARQESVTAAALRQRQARARRRQSGV